MAKRVSLFQVLRQELGALISCAENGPGPFTTWTYDYGRLKAAQTVGRTILSVVHLFARIRFFAGRPTNESAVECDR